MRVTKLVPRRIVVASGIVLGLVAAPLTVPMAVVATVAPAADKSASKERTASSTVVAFKAGTPTIKRKSGLVTYEQVGDTSRHFGTVKTTSYRNW
jgi:hypothetical protein